MSFDGASESPYISPTESNIVTLDITAIDVQDWAAFSQSHTPSVADPHIGSTRLPALLALAARPVPLALRTILIPYTPPLA